MTQNRIIQTTLAWQVDQSSIQTVTLANTKVLNSLQGVETAALSGAEQLANMGIAAEDVTVGGDSIVKLADQTIAAGDAAEQAAQQYKDMGQAAQDAAASGSQAAESGGDSGGIGIGGLRSGLRAGGFLLGGAAGGGDLRAASQIITLTSVLGPLGIVAGIAAIALRDATDAEQKRAEAAKQYFSDVGNVADKTSDQIKGQIQQQQQQLEAYKAAQGGLQKLADQADDLSRRSTLLPGQEGALSQDQYLAALDTLDAKVNAATGGVIKDAAGLTDALTEGSTQIDKTQGSINFFNLALGNTDTAANDAAAAAQKLAKSQEDAANLTLSIDKLTKDQRDTRAAQDMRDIDLINQRIQKGDLSNQATYDLSVQQQKLYDDYEALIGVSNTYGDQLLKEAAAKKAQTDATNNYLQAVTDQTVTQQAVIKAVNDRNEAEREHADSLAKIQQDEQDKEKQDRQQAATTAEDDTEKHLQKIADIEAQYASDHEADVGNRDALQNYKDAQKRTKDEAKENATYTLQEQQLQKHLAAQLIQERSAEQKSEQAETSSYMKRYGQLTTALNNAVIAEDRQQGLVAAYQAQADQNSLVAQTNHNAAVQSTLQSGFFTVEYLYQRHINTLQQIVSGALLSPGQVGTSLLGNPVFNAAFDSRFNQTMTAAYR